MRDKIVKSIKKVRVDKNGFDCLNREFSNLCFDKNPTHKIGKNYKTFVFWYQGISSKTPKTIKLCLGSIKKYCQNVTFIDKYNYSKYVQIPQFITNKFQAGQISITHFSDILRVWLLEKYGGLWLDATVFIYKKMPDFSDEYFYTIHTSYHNWVVSFLATGAHNPLFTNLKNMFSKYWQKYDKVIDYFIFDYFIKFQYNQCSCIKRMIDNVPTSNEYIFSVFKLYYRPYNRLKYEEFIKNGYLYKITYKHQKILNILPFTLYKHIIKENNIR